MTHQNVMGAPNKSMQFHIGIIRPVGRQQMVINNIAHHTGVSFVNVFEKSGTLPKYRVPVGKSIYMAMKQYTRADRCGVPGKFSPFDIVADEVSYEDFRIIARQI